MPDKRAASDAASEGADSDFPTLQNDLFLRACRREPVERTPVWIMRQAGRYLPEYRALREKINFLDSCRTPDVACEITLQPVRRLGVDAAILFSDILIPLPGMGVPVEFNPGPHIDAPIRTREAIEALRAPIALEAAGFVMDAVRLVRKELAGSVPLIGFAGAPFTIATYLVEGGASKSFSAIKALLVSDPPLAHRLLATCAETMASYLSAQVQAGAQAAMLFDTWAGILSPEDYRTFALPYARRVFEAVAAAAAEPGSTVSQESSETRRRTETFAGTQAGSLTEAPTASGSGAETGSPKGAQTWSSVKGTVSLKATSGMGSAPRIYYAGDAAGHLEMVKDVGADVIGLDWRLGLGDARARLGPNLALQGNLDPAVLLGPRDVIEERTARVLRQAKGEVSISPEEAAKDRSAGSNLEDPPGPALGHIFNLGHGILPETPPDHALFLIESVQKLSSVG